MTHGHPDYGAAAPATTIYTIQDMAELAARLGSIVTFDRRGNVIWLDDFESGIDKWVQWFLPAGGAISWDSTASRNGGFSCKLVTKDQAGAATQILRYHPYPVLSNVGFEFSVAREAHIYNILSSLTLYDGGTLYSAQVKYDAGSNKFKYLDHTYAWQDTGIEVDIEESTNLFNTIKLVVDFNLGEYKRLIVNNQNVDLSGKAVWQESDVTTAQLATAIYIKTVTANAAIAYVDDVILTQNEP